MRDEFSRPFGTYGLDCKIPALKRRAILKCPFGTCASKQSGLAGFHFHYFPPGP